MDNISWNVSPFTNNSLLWSIQQQHDGAQQGFPMNSNSLLYGGKMDLTGALFDPIEELQKVQTTNVASHSERVCKMVHQLDSTHVVPDFNSSQAALTANTSQNSNWVNGDYYMIANPSFNNLVEEYGLPNSNQLKIVNNGFLQDGKLSGASATKTASLESLDCLLSTTNSNTGGTSVEDDGFSIILSDCSSTKRRSHKEQSELKFDPKDQYFDILPSDSSATEGGFKLISENPPKAKKARTMSDKKPPSSSNINFQQQSSSVSSGDQEPDTEAIAKMKEMIYRAAAFRPVNLGLEVVEKPKRKNVRISTDPQTVAARQRRERISERIRVLQKLVPGGSKMDTATMLDEAANYLKFLTTQVKALENLGHKLDSPNCHQYPTNPVFSSIPLNHSFPMQNHFPLQNPNPIINHPKSC